MLGSFLVSYVGSKHGRDFASTLGPEIEITGRGERSPHPPTLKHWFHRAQLGSGNNGVLAGQQQPTGRPGPRKGSVHTVNVWKWGVSTSIRATWLQPAR